MSLTELLPPTARRDPRTTSLHGTTLHDDFAWMRDKSSPEVIEYLQAENAYTAAAMAGTEELQATLYREMLSHIKETDESLPYLTRGWWYITRTIEGLQYPIYCRSKANGPELADAATEETMLDVNKLAEGQPFMSVGGLSVSPDGNLLAYSTDNTGFRQYTLQIRDLTTGLDLPDSALRTGSFEWAADSKTLFYTVEDEQTKRQHQLWRHTLGTPEIEDVLVLEESDDRFNLGVGRTRDRQYLLLEAGSHTTSETRYLHADRPADAWQLIAPRVDEQEYSADHRDGFFYIRVNDSGDNFRIVRAPVTTPDRPSWVELVAEQPDAPLSDFDLFKTFVVTTRRRAGLPVLEVLRFRPDATLDPAVPISFPEPTYSAGGHINPDFETSTYRYSYTSLVSPASVFAYDVTSAESTLLKQQEVPGGFDRTLYGSDRVMIKAEDGVEVPVSIVYRRDTREAGMNPLYLYGYGSYGYPLPVSFSAVRLSLLDRGVILAYAHIRGGGELGDPWHDAGKMMQKRTTFTDFIAAAEQLPALGYGDSKKIAIEGGSAGGLLMGAVLNMRPDLFPVVLSHVPFVDVMNTMLDASLPLTVGEYEEWGNPNEAEAFAYMHSYSPYDQLREGDYPAMLVKTSLNDSQVMYWEPAKYVAKLRTLKRNTSPLLLHINMEAGHGGASGRYDYLKEIAFDYAFLLKELGR